MENKTSNFNTLLYKVQKVRQVQSTDQAGLHETFKHLKNEAASTDHAINSPVFLFLFTLNSMHQVTINSCHIQVSTQSRNLIYENQKAFLNNPDIQIRSRNNCTDGSIQTEEQQAI